MSADPFCVPELDAFLEAHGVWVAEDALELLQQAREEHARAAGLVALSAAHDVDLEVAGLGGELKPFQRAGVAYLLERRRAFLADEQGLGKTIEALAAVQADDAFPAVVVCPANLKLNWQRETSAWLPGRSIERLSGLGGGEDVTGRVLADVTIVNYEILGARLPELLAGEPRAVVVDEAHLCKNPAAKRTRAAQQLAAAVPSDGLVLALTGHAGRQPPRRAGVAAAAPRPPRGVRLGRRVRRPLQGAGRPPAAALAPAGALLRAPAEGRRAPAAAAEDALGRADRARPTSPSTGWPSVTSWRGCAASRSTCASSTPRSPPRCGPNGSCA